MNTNKNKTTKKKIIKRKARVKGRRLPNNRKKRTNVIRGRKIAAASAKGFAKRFTMLRQNGNSVRVSGRDLIYSIPDDLTSPIQSTNVITVIPANPAYWKGTRIAALASGYQNYRPILFKITYIPMCAVTQQGNVIGGTIWDDGIDNNNIQQSLRTSNGGFMTQCYVPHTTKIRPKSNLQFNLYRMGGEFSTTSNPFTFVALAIGCKNSSNQRITPGYFYVTWSFELKNPIGSINDYNNTGLTTFGQLQLSMNTTLINIDPNSDVPFGAYIDVEEGDNGAVADYNGTTVEILENQPIWAFTSVTKASTARQVGRIPIIYDTMTTSDVIITKNQYKAYILPNDENYIIYTPKNLPTNENYSWHITPSDPIRYEIINLNQNFGTLLKEQNVDYIVYDGDTYVTTATSKFKVYVAPRSMYKIELISNKTREMFEKLTLEQEEEDNSKVEENEIILQPKLLIQEQPKKIQEKKHK